MSILDRALRKKLADTIIAARQVAEDAAADAVRRLGIIDDEAPTYLPPDQKALRVRLRAHARTLGDQWNAEKKKLLTTTQLENEAAYEIWHRMLFGRFLVERDLLIHPDLGVPIAGSELADLAREAGEPDPWSLVERFAAPSLPGVFKPDDPVLAMTIDPALSKRLRDLVAALPVEVFTADDSLGWTYQFWRTVEKEAVNKAGGKVGATELPAVTQLFTEPYMVKFLLHNTMGAWWAGKVLTDNPDLARDAKDEQVLRDACALPGVDWEYLRFVRGPEVGPWRLAAGSFPNWPSKAADITYCDPCCGSGHFLVEALAIFAALRQWQEGLPRDAAVCAVLRQNLHGLELDERCVQIAAFNVALAAWKIAGVVVALPQPLIAWVGAPQSMSQSEMRTLANGDPAFGRLLEGLHGHFEQAPVLGSLIQIDRGDLLDCDLRSRVAETLTKLRELEPERAEGAIAARGLLEAVDLLTKRYLLLATNVPFLGRGRQEAKLANYIGQTAPEAKPDLSTAMVQRMRAMTANAGVLATVTPQHWLYLSGYKMMRQSVLQTAVLSVVAGLGTRAFQAISGEVVNAALIIMREAHPDASAEFAALNANEIAGAAAKAVFLRNAVPLLLSQSSQERNASHRIMIEKVESTGQPISDYASILVGATTGDAPRFIRKFWEWRVKQRKWEFFQSTTPFTQLYGGMTDSILWEMEQGELSRFVESVKHLNHIAQNWRRGKPNWSGNGVSVSMMGELTASIYTGEIYDSNCCAIVPHDPTNLAAFWTYCQSPEFNKEVRKANQNLKIEVGSILESKIDINHWRQVASERYADGLPEPSSDDPTQWVFHGHPAFAERGTELHVVLARIGGYRWPSESDSSLCLSQAARDFVASAASLPGCDGDGIVSLQQLGSERSLADRMREVLAAAYGTSLSQAQELDLVRRADTKLDKREARDQTIEVWLRDRAFRQHCALFHHRPFLWQVWDTLPDGFSAFLYYHVLDHSKLEKLTFTVLGDWLSKARSENRTAHENRALQLQQRLRDILQGDAPYDIFVRWKPLIRQPVGWHPDLDDGVRPNIRPFVRAGVLREQPRINWKKDRGTDLPSVPGYHLGPQYGGNEGDRINDHHLSLAQKRAAGGLAA